MSVYGLDCNILDKTKDMNHQDWLESRKLGLTGTDIGGITGINKYSSPIKVYLNKLGELPETADNEVMYWGRVMEDVIAKEFSRRNSIYRIQKVNAILQHKKEKWALGNIDRLITNELGQKGILEIKTVSEYISSAWDDDKVPEHYMLQLQWYLYITNTDFGYFAALIGGNKYIQKYVERNDEVIKMMKDIGKDFWFNNVLKKVPPAVDGSDASTKLLTNLYPQSVEDSSIDLAEEDEELIQKRNILKKQIKELEEQVSNIENQFKEELKENEIGIAGSSKVIWKTFTRHSIDTKRLKSERPDVFKNYSKESSYRKFDIKKLS